jgi:cation-transporting ATPase 13A3/4/5
MCGDGANDCGALKRADVGISLSSAEASIAAPFTSQIANISCVTVVLREGRCALATSLQEFKYMALYSMIQFVTVATLYWFAVNLTDAQFLIIDLFTMLPLAMFMSKTGPHSQLSKVKPIGELVSFPVLSSVIGQTVLVTVFQVAGLYLVINQSFYSEVYVSDANDEDEASQKSYCYENTVMFL